MPRMKYTIIDPVRYEEYWKNKKISTREAFHRGLQDEYTFGQVALRTRAQTGSILRPQTLYDHSQELQEQGIISKMRFPHKLGEARKTEFRRFIRKNIGDMSEGDLRDIVQLISEKSGRGVDILDKSWWRNKDHHGDN